MQLILIWMRTSSSSSRFGAYRVSPKSSLRGPSAPSKMKRVSTASKLPSQNKTGLVGASGEMHRMCVYCCCEPCPEVLVCSCSEEAPSSLLPGLLRLFSAEPDQAISQLITVHARECMLGCQAEKCAVMPDRMYGKAR